MTYILYGTQEKETTNFFFIPEVVKMLDGVRLVETLSINDIALTCVALINCIDIYFLKQQESTTEISIHSMEHSTTTNKGSSDTSILTSCFTLSQDDSTLLSKSSTWNSHLRKKPKIYEHLYGILDYQCLSKRAEANKRMLLFTGAKRFTGGQSGSGHAWLRCGVDKYESIRKQLILEHKVFKEIHFECKTMMEKNIGLTDILNGDDTDDTHNISLTDKGIKDIINSGQFSSV